MNKRLTKADYDELAAKNSRTNRINGITLTHAREMIKHHRKFGTGKDLSAYGIHIEDLEHFQLERTGNTVYSL